MDLEQQMFTLIKPPRPKRRFCLSLRKLPRDQENDDEEVEDCLPVSHTTSLKIDEETSPEPSTSAVAIVDDNKEFAAFDDPKYDSKPPTDIVCDSNSTAIGTGSLPKQDLEPNWTGILQDIVAEIGIDKLMRLVRNTPSVRPAELFKAVLEAEELRELPASRGMLEYVTSKFSLNDIIKHYDVAAVNQWRNDLRRQQHTGPTPVKNVSDIPSVSDAK